MESELLGLVSGLVLAFVLQHSLQALCRREILVDAFGDSNTTFISVAKNTATMTNRLQINVVDLHESHANGTLRSLGWF